MAGTAQHCHQDDEQRDRDREGLARRHIGHEHRVDAAGNTGQRGGNCKSKELEGKGGNAHHLGDVLVVADGEQSPPEPRMLDRPGCHQRSERQHYREEIDRRGGAAIHSRKRYAAEEYSLPTVYSRIEHDRRDNERHRQCQEGEQLPPQAPHAEYHRANCQREQGRQESGDRQRPKERHLMPRHQHGRRVHADAEKSAVAERQVTGKAAEDRPRGRERDPEEHQVEERLDECRRIEQRHCGERRRGRKESRDRALLRPAQSCPRRRTSTATSREKETSGAQVGSVTAMVSASLTPIPMPARRTPTGLPIPPRITTAKMIPIQA